MINLCLVVIATQFSETKQRENALMREQRARYMSNDSTLASYSEPGSCYEEMLRYISHLYRKFTRRLQRIYSGWHRLDMGCLVVHFIVRARERTFSDSFQLFEFTMSNVGLLRINKFGFLSRLEFAPLSSNYPRKEM